MIYYKRTLLFLIIFSIISCGKNKENEEHVLEQNKVPNYEQKVTVNPESQKKDSTDTITTDSIKVTNESILSEKSYTKKRIVTNIAIENPVKNNTNPSEKTTKPAKTETDSKKEFINSFVYIKKILSECKIGVPMTQKDLETNYNIPKEGIQLVKSVTKISENELDVKWKSTWLIEKVSDAKFKDGRLKLRFDKNKMYTSGCAIAIKYEKKMYTDLILIGRSAYIPTVKGYYWQIGKD
jgi:hypothetical protein